MSYYTLMPTRLVSVGQPVPEPENGELSAWTSPRAIAIAETVAERWSERDEIGYLLDGSISLVQVSQVGTVESAYIDGGTRRTCRLTRVGRRLSSTCRTCSPI